MADFFAIPGALSEAEQQQLTEAALREYPQPPARSNHSRRHGPLPGLWEAAQADLRLRQDVGCACMIGSSPKDTCSCTDSCWEADGSGPPARQLLRKLRWVTLGPQFDWTARVYDGDVPHAPLPPQLRALALRFAAACAEVNGSACEPGACSPSNSQDYTCSAAGMNPTAWEPDVALVNYYREGETLGGHIDDVERDQDAPIVALSLGCPAIFLLGGALRFLCAAA
jgi:alkylated DNA repair protein alkB family protein 1